MARKQGSALPFTEASSALCPHLQSGQRGMHALPFKRSHCLCRSDRFLKFSEQGLDEAASKVETRIFQRCWIY